MPVWPQVWSSGDASPEYSCSNLVDGDTNTLWVGNPGGSPWRVNIDFGQVLPVSNLDVLFFNTAWTNMGLIGSRDAVEWFDFLTLTNWPASSRYLYMHLWNDASRSNPPAVREIRR